MRHKNDSTQRISDNFERFNPYASAAVEKIADEESQTYATLALAFELSQLRYQLSKLALDDDTRARLSSAR